MKAYTWLKTLCGRLSARAARRPIRRTIQLRLEVLEDRTVPTSSPALAATYGNLPLLFEVNQGQAAPQVDFLSRGNGYTLSLTPAAALLDLGHGAAQDELRMQLVGANPLATVAGQDELATKTNYLIGSDPSQWRTNIANYGQVTYQNVYSGVNVVYYGNQGQLEYDFVVASGADPGAIKMSIQGAKGISLDAQGNLVMHTAGADVVEHAPVIYQEGGGVRRAVSGRFVLEGNDGVGFAVGAYDRSRPLIIDPVLSYSTYLGGSGNDYGDGIAVDTAGNAYMVGGTTSANFPTTGGASHLASVGRPDVFVAKLNASGTGLVYSTYLGGDYDDIGSGIAVDSAGNAYVTGNTNSDDFPTTANAFQQTSYSGDFRTFVAKLNATGSALLYSTYLGGTVHEVGGEKAYAIAVDGAGNAYVTGDTSSTTFPTKNAFQPAHADYDPASIYEAAYTDAFVTKLNATGTALVYSTFLGGTGDDSGHAIAVDSAGNAYVTGTTSATYPTDPSQGILAFPTTLGAFQTSTAGQNGVPFVTELNATGTALVYSTFLSGATSAGDSGNGIAVDAAGNAYVTGSTQASDFPTTSGALQPSWGGISDAFVTKLNASGSALVYSTYLGGSASDGGSGIAVDGLGNAYIVGNTVSGNFPTVNALQPVSGGDYDAFVATVNAAGSALLDSTYLGGRCGDGGNGVAVDAAGNAYVVGTTSWSATSSTNNFPTTPGTVQGMSGGGSDAFVAKMSLAASPSFSVGGFPSPATAGVAGSFTVSARNADGTPATNYTGTVHFGSSDAQAVLPADYTFTAADQGVHTFTATLKTAGAQSIAATDITTPDFAGTESGIVVKPAAASTLVVAGFPSPTTAGSAHGFTVTAKDPYGNTVAYTGTVHFTSSDGQAVLPANYTFTAANLGVHTFSAILKTAGTQSITAIDTSTTSITGTDAGITVNPAAASRFVITAPSSVSAGSALSLTITVLDAYGNVATGYTGTIHFTSTDGTATLPANYTFTAADNGIHTFTGLVLRKKNTQKITITDTLNISLSGSVTEKVL
jgi:hypothetical protein